MHFPLNTVLAHCMNSTSCLIMAALHSRCGHYIFILWFLLSFFPRLTSAVGDWMYAYFYTWCGLSANLECRSETCCAPLAEIQDAKYRHKKSPSGHHPTTLSGYIFATKACIDNRKKSFVKQQYLLHMSLQYGELRPTSGWDRFVSLGHPCKFQRVSRLGSVTVRYSSSGRQPNFAALNRGRHLYSAGRPSRLALANISSFFNVFDSQLILMLLYDSLSFVINAFSYRDSRGDCSGEKEVDSAAAVGLCCTHNAPVRCLQGFLFRKVM